MDDTAHRAALGAALVTGYAGLLADQLTVDDFEPGWQQLVYTTITELHAAGRTADAEAVIGHVQATGRWPRADGAFGVFVAELYEAATFPPEPERHIAAVIETSYRRTVWQATTRIRQACTEYPLAAVLSIVDRELTGALEAAARLGNRTTETGSGIPGLAAILDGLSETPAA